MATTPFGARMETRTFFAVCRFDLCLSGGSLRSAKHQALRQARADIQKIAEKNGQHIIMMTRCLKRASKHKLEYFFEWLCAPLVEWKEFALCFNGEFAAIKFLRAQLEGERQRMISSCCRPDVMFWSREAALQYWQRWSHGDFVRYPA